MIEYNIKRKSKYMIYNHGYIFIKEFESLDNCKHWAINHLDQSNEIIIRIVNYLSNKITVDDDSLLHQRAAIRGGNGAGCQRVLQASFWRFRGQAHRVGSSLRGTDHHSVDTLHH